MVTAAGIPKVAIPGILATLILLAWLCICSAQPAAGYWDTFELPDGEFPQEWQWTGYSEEGGRFLVYGEAFRHVEGGAVYYYRDWGWRSRNLPASYEIIVKDSYWVFAWRISADNPSAGRCLWLSHDDLSGTWGYTYAECAWENLNPEEYPDGQFMWHNTTVLRSVHHATPGPLVGWHSVHIWEEGPNALDLEIRVDWDLIFDESYEYIPEGYQGVGCLGGGAMTPAFDSIWAQWPDPVEDGTWGRLKALYR